MTCITGMVRNGHVYMAGDMMGSNGFTGRVYPDSKVFVNGDFIIGYTSSFRMGQILEWNWKPPLRQEGISDREYMQLNVVESLRETFAVFGYGVKDGLEDIGGNFLIGYKDSLYEMQNNFSLLSIPDYASVGSGCYHAEAILHMLYYNEGLHPFQIMQEAIATAAHFTQSVSEECTVFSTDEEANEEWERLAEEELNATVTKDEMEALSKEEIIARFFPDGSKDQEDEGGALPEDLSEAIEERIRSGMSAGDFVSDYVDDFNESMAVSCRQESFCKGEDNVKLLYLFDNGSIVSYDKSKEEFTFTPSSGKEVVDHRLYAFLCEDDIKELADDMEIRYAHNISTEKLAQRIKDFVDKHFGEF